MKKKYNCCLLVTQVFENEDELSQLTHEIKELCNQIIVAIPGDHFCERVFRKKTSDCFTEINRIDFLSKLNFVDDYIVFDETCYHIEDLIQKKSEIDCVYWGEGYDLAEDYGYSLQDLESFIEEERAVLRKKNIDFIDCNQKGMTCAAKLRLRMWAEDNYLKRAQPILKDMLFEFDRICRENDIEYYVIFGALLGLVRHKDFIPWDDDIDVAMSRENYEKFREIAIKEWGKIRKKTDINSSQKYAIQEPLDLGKNVFYDYMIRMVSYKGTVPTRLFDKVKNQCEMDVYDRMVIDIYVLDKYSNNERKHRFCTNVMKGIYTFAMGHRDFVDYGEYSVLSGGEKMLLKTVNAIGNTIPTKLLYNLYNKFGSYAKKENTDKFFLSNRPIMSLHASVKGEWLTNPVDMEMDGHKVMVPCGYEEMLRQHYDDYMMLPPYSERMPFHYIYSSGTLQGY